jgi:uncharacterized membrane protein YgdD (TMEM256/DUF423 family)
MRWVGVGAVVVALGIALGAFGAHALKDTLSSWALERWHTAQTYQMWGGLSLILCGLIGTKLNLKIVPGLMLAGTLIFAGTVYGLALGGPRWLGAITPIGGVLLITSWLLVAFQALRAEPRS